MPRSGGEVYGGACGKTRTRRIFYSCPCGLVFGADVHVAVNVTKDPALGAKLRQNLLNHVKCPNCNAEQRVEIPVVFHDEDRHLLILVLPTSLRWRELEERADLLLTMADDKSTPIPGYAREFHVVWGGPGLVLALAAHQDAQSATTRPTPLADPELGAETGPFEKYDPIADTVEPTGSVRLPPEVRDVTLERWMISRAPTLHLVEQGRARLCAGLPSGRIEPFLHGALSPRIQLFRTPNFPLVVLAIHKDEDEGVDPLTFHLDLSRVEDRAVLGALGHAFQLSLELYDSDYLQVTKRQIDAPLAENVRAIGAAAEAHMATLPVAQRSFEAGLATWHSPSFDRHGRREHNLEEDSFMLLPTPGTARLALGIVGFWSEPENEDYLLYVKSFPLPWWRRIRSRVLGRCLELGLVLPTPLGQLAITEGLVRSRKDLAHKLVHNFAGTVGGQAANDLDPQAIRDNWQALIAECEALGVPLEGRAGDLAAVAVGAMPPTNDLPRRTTGSGVPPATVRPSSGAASQVTRKTPPPELARRSTGASNDLPPASGTIGGAGDKPAPRPASSRSERAGRPERTPTPVIAGEIAARGVPGHRELGKAPTEELISLLEDKDLRRDAAIDLCRRGEGAAVGPVFGALRRMTRGEAVRVLPGVVSFGERAVPHLVDGLRSRKAFLRQGCALALGVLKSSDGVESLCDLLLAEPTDVWREVARAIGETGAGAVMTLGARIRETHGQNGASPEGELSAEQKRERIAWALAHVAARGARANVEMLAEGRDPTASQVARRALELTGTARTNDHEVRGAPTPRDQTVNRAFSRRFFEALAGRAPRPLAVETDGEDEELSLDDAEILDEEEVLDDEDLIPG